MPVGPPAMLAPESTVMSPPVPKIGPGVEGAEMIWGAPLQAAAGRGEARAARAKSEAPASSASRQASRPGTDADESNALRNAAAPSPNSSPRPMDSLDIVALPCRPPVEDWNNNGRSL